jgi:hypothetical protein
MFLPHRRSSFVWLHGKIAPAFGEEAIMRNVTCCLLVVLFGSCLNSLGQSAPKFTSPQIVATFERIGRTGDIAPTTIYTPKEWGTFRISIVMVGTVANGQLNSYWGGELGFTDGAGDSSRFEIDLAIDKRRTDGNEFPIRAKAGKPITFSVISNGDTSGTKYNVWVVVEQLM